MRSSVWGHPAGEFGQGTITMMQLGATVARTKIRRRANPVDAHPSGIMHRAGQLGSTIGWQSRHHYGWSALQQSTGKVIRPDTRHTSLPTTPSRANRGAGRMNPRPSTT